MSSIKIFLKAAKTALDAHDYVAAAEEANKALALDAKSYHAQVFLGLALEKQDQYDASEAAYKTAASLKEGDLLAWQGLVSLYEKQAGKKLDEYHDAALRVAQLHMDADDRFKCQTVIDTYTSNAKKYGSRTQYKRSLETLLPSSPVYDFLDGRIPQPASTYVKIAEIVEDEEKAKINTEIGQRRTRLGAKIDRVTAEVRREVFEKSPLETLYFEVINWTHEDELRREFEEKLLIRASETLAVLPQALKTAKRQQVQKLAEGIVILKHPFKLAWNIHLIHIRGLERCCLHAAWVDLIKRSGTRHDHIGATTCNLSIALLGLFPVTAASSFMALESGMQINGLRNCIWSCSL